MARGRAAPTSMFVVLLWAAASARPTASAPPLPQVTFAIAGQVQPESAGQVLVSVQLEFAVAVDVELPYLVSGSATQPDDYTIAASPLTIPAGQTGADIPLTVVDDLLNEGAETILIVMGEPSGASVGAIEQHLCIIAPSDGLLNPKGPPAPTTLPLTVSPPGPLEFPAARLGDPAQVRSLLVRNLSGAPVTLAAAEVVGRPAGEFTATPLAALPLVLPDGASTTIEVRFAPTQRGARRARLVLQQTPYAVVVSEIPLLGTAYGPVGAEILLNAGGKAYVGENQEKWAEDYGYAGASSAIVLQSGQVQAPADAHLYRTAREGFFAYSLELPNGVYAVDLHFAEIVATGPGQRRFEVLIEGAQALVALDLYALVGKNTALVVTHRATVADGRLDIVLRGLVGSALLNALEARAVPATVPVAFAAAPISGITQPTALDWGPDGRLWVASRTGVVHAFTFDESYAVQGMSTYAGVSGLSNHEILGLAFDPYDPAGLTRVLVAHSELYAQGGGSFTGPSPYPGQVSVLTGPAFDTPVPLITGLPTSNHDHAANGMVFDNNGDLLLCMGGNTNAGIRWPIMGDLPESPLSGAVVKSHLSRPGFDGALFYIERATQLVNSDQVFGEIVDLAPGLDVEVHASGLRNSFDLVYTTAGRLYATDNGANAGFGPASTGPSSQTGTHPDELDELVLVEYDHYYGHPNRNRGRDVAEENVFFGAGAASQTGFTQALVTLPASTNGVVEYRAATFLGAMRGELLAQRWNNQAQRLKLSADGRSVVSQTLLDTQLKGLDLRTGPGGALIASDYSGNKLRPFVPVDAGVSGATVYDILPWRAPASGGTPFVIGGENLGTLATTTVTIGGLPASLTSVTARRIRGTLPAHAAPTTELVDVVVNVAGAPRTLPAAFLFLPAQRGSWPGRWESGPSLPRALGEVAAAAIGHVIYVVGAPASSTLAYDVLAGTWSDTLAPRPFAGSDHSAEVHQGKLYLVGGLGAGSPGTVQIYAPATNTWSLGASMPWAGGAVSTARIGDKIYAAGGLAGGVTVDDCAVYDIGSDTWTVLAPMPAGQGRNRAAAGTDGERLFVFGGRTTSGVSNGFPDVQIYDPLSDTWQTSLDPGSTLAPLPVARSGMGKSRFYKGELYVFGGETLDGPGAEPGGVYARVDVYDPIANAWREEALLPTPRHGSCPVLIEGRVYLPGGGTSAGASPSSVLESFSRQ